jgi:hypothetical protein
MILFMTRFARFRRAFAAALALATLAFPAAAQEDGWFEKPAPAPAPAPPSTSAPSDKPPLAPSPLLEKDSAPPPEDDEADRDPRALTYWNPHLAPYGVWVDDPSYGRVWVPHAHVVGTDFAPYVSSGHWALDENEEWIWVSDYPFGGVVFHYGRWVWISGRGWAWIPGMRYAPAWVAWRTPVGSYGYVGWAPLPPLWVWFGGVAVVYSYGPYYPWVFCHSEYLFHHHVHHHIFHDHYRIQHAARHTRPYRVASPRPVAGRVATRASPTPRAANVPAHAVPRERVSSRLVASQAPRSAATTGVRGRSSALPPPNRPALRGAPAPSRAADTPPLLRKQPREAPASRDVTPRNKQDLAPAGERKAAPRVQPSPSPSKARPSKPERPRIERPTRPSLERAPRRIEAPRSPPGRDFRGAPGRTRVR